MDKELEQLQKDIVIAQTKLDETVSAINREKLIVEEVKALNLQLAKETIDKKSSIELLDKEHNEKVSNFNILIKKHNEQIVMLSYTINEKNLQLSNIQGKIDIENVSYNEQVQKRESELQSLDTQIAKKQIELVSVGKDIDILEQGKAIVLKEKDAIVTKNNDLLALISKKNGEIEELVDNIEYLQGVVENDNKIIADLKKINLEEWEKFVWLQNSISDSKKVINELDIEKSNKEKELAILQLDIDKITREKFVLQERTDALNRREEYIKEKFQIAGVNYI